MKNAQNAGVRHILAAIDNDGGARRHPPHDASHVRVEQVEDAAGCRLCKLESWLPEPMIASVCIAVPVQALEVWLLAAGGHPFSAPTPEQAYDRRALKKALYGSAASNASRTQIALEILAAPRDPLRARLLERPSYRLFSHAATTWK